MRRTDRRGGQLVFLDAIFVRDVFPFKVDLRLSVGWRRRGLNSPSINVSSRAQALFAVHGLTAVTSVLGDPADDALRDQSELV